MAKKDPSPHRGKHSGVSGEAHAKAKLTWEKVRYIRENPDGLIPRQLAEKFGVSRSTINQVLSGATWKE